MDGLMSSGKELDKYGRTFNIYRKRFFFFFKESDKSFRNRIKEAYNSLYVSFKLK